jgi:tRNA A-37 threonylcarbamoyl transferase component Bud32
MTTPPPDIPDRWKLGQKIGAGGTATVYRATDRQEDRRVALKLWHDHLSADELVRSRVRSAFEAARRVDSPHAVDVYEVIETEATIGLAMEYLDGGSLADRLARRGSLDWPEVVDLADGLLDALEAAHAAGIIHRHVHPSDILFAEDGTVKIGDFGAARVDELVALTTQSTAMGRVGYRAPELLQSADIDGRADLFSLGVLLYEALTGERPFAAARRVDTLRQMRADEPPAPGQRVEVPSWLDAVVRRALRANPDDRFPNAAAFLRAIERADAGALQPVQTPETCPECGMPRLPQADRCLECDSLPGGVVRDPGKGDYSLVLPAHPDQLRRAQPDEPFAHRDRLFAALRESGLTDPRYLTDPDRPIRRPSHLVDGLTEPDAHRLQSELADRGVSVELVGPADSLMAVMAPVYGIEVGSAAFVFWLLAMLITVLLVGSSWLSWLYGIAFIGALGFKGFQFQRGLRRARPLVSLAGDEPSTERPEALARLVERLRQLPSERSRAVALTAIGDSPTDDVAAKLDRLLDCERRRAENSVVELVETTRRLDAQIAAEEDMERVEELIAEKTACRQRLEELDELDLEVAEARNELLTEGAG